MSLDLFFSELNIILNNFVDHVVQIAPSFIFALVVLFVGYILGRIIKYLTKKIILKLPRLFKNEKLKTQLYHINFENSATHASNVIFWIIIIFTLTIISELLGLPIITSWISGIVFFLPNFLIAIFIIFLGIIGGRLTGSLIVSAANKADMTYGSIIGKIAQYVIFFISLIIAVDQLGIEISFLIQLVDIILAGLLFGGALAFGLGAKKSVSNILASYYIHNNYRKGDRIKIDGIEGEISQINATSVLLDTKEGQVNIPATYFSDKKSFLLNRI